MGTFASLFKSKGSAIPEEKKEEFINKIEKVFQAGGMMGVEKINLFGKSINTIHKIKMEDDGMSFFYNYFEDDCWESAGFDRNECCVWSNKIGWREFYFTVVAAYVLESQYTEGVSLVIVDGQSITSWVYMAWLNYLFDEKNHTKNYDLWKVFEETNYLLKEEEVYIEWDDDAETGYEFISKCEICSVINGYEKALEIYENKGKGEVIKIAFEGMKSLACNLQKYANGCKLDKESQIKVLIRMIRSYYETDEISIDSICSKEEMCYAILDSVMRADAPAFVIKVMSEIYDKDFWELWNSIKDVAKRKNDCLYGNKDFYIVPISTEKIFRRTSDDMIIYGEKGSDMKFSEELLEWLKKLKEQYDKLMVEEVSVNIKYVVELLEEVNSAYYNIYAFTDFFEETLENIYDKRYQVLWKIFHDIAYDSEMMEVGNVIFAPDSLENKKMGMNCGKLKTKRKLVATWSYMNASVKNNKARVTLRRYMELMANKELRYRVFGV